jgi:glycerol transport system ATP-binding protein
LLLGGSTATLHQGRVTQFGPTSGVYRGPGDLITARTFSDPPLNTLPAEGSGWNSAPSGAQTLGFRPHHLRIGAGSDRALRFHVSVISTEITGSESFVHVSFGGQRWVMLTHGVHVYPPETRLDLYVEPEHVMAFDASGRTIGPVLREAA